MFKLAEPSDDGLVIPEVGPWSAHKHHFLRRYIDAFTNAMKAKRWSSLHYIDLFAGAGLERIKGNGLEWGSPLIAAQAPHQFSRLHLCELDARKCGSLWQRVQRLQLAREPQVVQGDANVEVAQIVDAVPERALSLAFLDPFGLHLNFETLKRLSERRADLVIFFPDHLDALRNWEIYAAQPNSNLDRVLGTRDWLPQLRTSAQKAWGEVLTRVYVDQIGTLGYTEFDYERISLPNGRFLYRLIFCSRSKVAAGIWRRVASRKPGGQATFDFGESD